jgi:hypothetical protein
MLHLPRNAHEAKREQTSSIAFALGGGVVGFGAVLAFESLRATCIDCHG